MKRLIIINGTMGVGKTTTCMKLQELLPKNVFLDGDWCWHMNPFTVTEETKTMAVKNIIFLLNNFLRCTEYDNIIFCWVMHQQEIIDSILEQLYTSGCKVHIISLICSKTALSIRLNLDITNGKRSQDILERSISRINNYHGMDSTKIDVSNISPFEAANRIKEIIGGNIMDYYIDRITPHNISLIYMPKVGKFEGHGHIYVDELWVEPSHRKKGYANQLMKKADELKQKLSATGLRLYVNVNNPGAQKLYDGCGFHEDGTAIFMEKYSSFLKPVNKGK